MPPPTLNYEEPVNPLGGSVGGVAHTPPVGPSRAGTGKGYQ